MSKKKYREQHFSYKQYRKLALVIHKRICDDPEFCNYGKPCPPELEDDQSLSWDERAERAGKRLTWCDHCQGAVDAENIAAQIIITKKGKIRVQL